MYGNDSMVARTKGDLIMNSNEIINLLNGVIDDVILHRKFTFNFYDFLCAEGISKKEIEEFNQSKFIGVIQSQVTEFDDFLKGGDPYLREAYSGYSKPEVRKMRNYIQGLIMDGLRYEETKRKRRPYKKRRKTTTK